MQQNFDIEGLYLHHKKELVIELRTFVELHDLLIVALLEELNFVLHVGDNLRLHMLHVHDLINRPPYFNCDQPIALVKGTVNLRIGAAPNELNSVVFVTESLRDNSIHLIELAKINDIN